jgi:pimeloyl-ACP methyl ester carboxylesterase
MIGFGQWAMPTVDEFDYTFDTPTDVTAALLEQLGVDRFAVHAQGYGAPIAWGLATRAPQRITAIITQNGNGSTDGFVKAFWDPLFAYAENPTPENEAPLRGALTLELTRWQHLNGVADPSLVSPDSWTIDLAPLDRPGNDAIQPALFRDYPTNVALYPQLQQYFRDSQVPLPAVGGPTTKSSARTEPAPSHATCPTPRSISSSPDTSPWRATWRKSPGTFATSSHASPPEPHARASPPSVTALRRTAHCAGRRTERGAKGHQVEGAAGCRPRGTVIWETSPRCG